MLIRFTSLFLVCLFFAGCGRKAGKDSSPPVSWSKDLRPLLAAKCAGCHGAGQAPSLPEGAFVVFDPGAGSALVPGAPDQSTLWTRIQAGHPDELRSDPDAAPTLAPGERAMIRDWIREGARHEAHWAFQPLPATVPVPDQPAAPPAHDIDRFTSAGRDPQDASPADPLRWLRRVSFDLTGLPPTGAEMDAFLLALRDPDGREEAHAAVVDRLLASPAYGERMAAAWLATIRYADTWNFAGRPRHTQWLYRDRVVRAFNENLPYHRFLTQQLAGDLLDTPAEDEILATAFLRNHPLPPDGKAGREILLADLAAERVHLAGSALLGLTLECARCHRHPADPFTPRTFHRLADLFAAAGESRRAGAPDVVPAPTLPLPTDEQDELLRAATERIAALENRLADLPAERTAAFDAWREQEGQLPVIADAAGIFAFEETGGTIRNHALRAAPAGTAEGIRLVEGVHGSAAQFTGDGVITFPGLLEINRWNAWTVAMWMLPPASGSATVVRRGDPAQAVDLGLDGGSILVRLFRDWPGNAIAVRTVPPVVRANEWIHLAWTYDGSGSAAGLRLYANGKPLETTIVADRLRKSAVPALPAPLRLGGDGFAGGCIDDFQVYARALTPLEAAHLHDGRALLTAVRNADEDLEAIADYYFSSIDPEARRTRKELAAARHQFVELEHAVLEVAVMAEPSGLRPGDGPASPGDDPSPPALLPPPAAAAGSGLSRLDLAVWLTSRDHPLTARVFVNRLWAIFFGEGIVATDGDIGLMSAAPSHPDLLDWLARDFIDSGWDVKRLCRQIALSATYRRESAAHPPRPLSPLEMRDLALTASGLRDDTMGGPPVRPDKAGPDRYRRGLYAVWTRRTPRLLPVAVHDPASGQCRV
ncbi:MAG: DUF1549 domain-containing protein, partial [Akkermansiaceae bacterium]|nr:DUF1549 domain-containing protein [Akkermansiaceae bacterium]